MDASKRGPYAKGKVRRKEILDAALTIVGSDGFDQTTLSKISEVVGISDVAVLHYFDSMDDLMIQVLKQRDLNDIQSTETSMPDRSVDMRSIAGQAINRLLCRQAPASQDITEQ
ncbi:TetR/AcrR family transcriptional regulator [Bifidobacterium sp.]|jgi:AcrR family transcriptional regulator|uniref:TetR/AcrR family transcriptional regulator n=1 Tax=Bifidobacterium sp. TaxID=41200 RepID=UPI0025B8A2A4|nr:helix-turn-helix domain-containing protein [Bifidobacterium sp.]MCI1635944.1 TetR/AcrR family transcriptional regulator [Bifidobacterium sp.]